MSKEREEYVERKRKRPSTRHTWRIVAAVAVIIVVAGTLVFYETRTAQPPSTLVYCGVFEYVVFPAQTISGASTVNATETMTTGLSYTTTTSVTGHVGQTVSTVSTTTVINANVGTEQGGIETICKYLSTNSTSTSSG